MSDSTIFSELNNGKTMKISINGECLNYIFCARIFKTVCGLLFDVFIFLCGDETGTNTNSFNIYCNVSNICKISCLSSNACSNLRFHCFEAGSCFVDCDASAGINCPSYGVYGIWTTQKPSMNPTTIPSNIPNNFNYNYSNISNLIPTTQVFEPSETPTSFTPFTSRTTTVNYFQLFNLTSILDILFNSTLKKYNATNLNNNIVLKSDIARVLEQVSESKISNTIDNVIAINIQQIWAYNQSLDVDNCFGAKLEQLTSDHYLSWIRLYVKFIDLDKQEEWINALEEIIDVFDNEISKLEYFINDTISIYYCESAESHSGNNSINLQLYTIIVTICIISLFLLIGFCACADARMFRRNENFSISAILSAGTYTVDLVSGCVDFFLILCFFWIS